MVVARGNRRTRVLLGFVSANHDGTVFENLETPDIHREQAHWLRNDGARRALRAGKSVDDVIGTCHHAAGGPRRDRGSGGAA
jgi:hypothetical protein